MLRYIVLILCLVLAVGICGCVGGFAGLNWLWILPAGFLGSFLGVALVLFLTAWIASLFVNTEKRQEKDSPFFRKLIAVLVSYVLWLLKVRVHTRGLEQTPRDGRFLLVCNHLNDLDPVILLEYFRDSQLAFISKRENTSMFLVGRLMHKIMCQLVNRENDREALRTILRCVELLKEDMVSVAVFPEGYTSRDGLLHPFRSGVLKIAQKAKVPVVVCTLQNTRQVFHNALRRRPTDVQLHLLDVIRPEQMQGMTAVELGNRIHAMMAEDLGPALVLQTEETT